jgi:ubiquinone/menaquinone biosynthesis C-methylase UbiE
MSWLFAKLYDRIMQPSELACLGAWREELLGSLFGTVLELGAGTGRNLDHYPPSVERLILAEPDREMRAILSERARAENRGRVDVIEDAAERLSLADGSIDAVVSTLVLCSVADPLRALGEVRRVLVPGGRFAFIEHVRAVDGSRRLVWQKRVEPVWKRVAGNCHLTRDTAETIRTAGFTIEWLRRESVRKAMPLARPSIRGIARRPEA